MSLTRRTFLTYVGTGTAALLADPVSSAPFPNSRREKLTPPLGMKPILPSRKDELVLAEPFRSNVIISWGDALGTEGPEGAETFGFNNDFIAYFPIDARSGGRNPDEGLLWVNHEYMHPLFVSGFTGKGKKTREQIRTEKLCVGGSIIHVRREGENWKHLPGSKFTRRFTALYPEIAVSGPSAEQVPLGIGTLANCSGGRTPWFTALSCEENYPDYNLGGRWSDVPAEAIDDLQYGWIVEVDPFNELPPKKHSHLGRFKHENAAVHVGPTGRIVVYMGDDEVDQHLYKYVSAGKYQATASRAANQKLLEDGVLMVADFARGQWIELVYSQVKDTLAKTKVKLTDEEKKTLASIGSQGELLIYTRLVAKALGATPLDRCEDCEVHPLDGSLYVALTNNSRHGNYYGQIVRLVEDDDNAEGTRFRYEIFLAGGAQTGVSCPDNLAFDKAGNLWVVCDMSTEMIGSSPKKRSRVYEPFGNNGLFVVPTRGENAGEAFQFASGPVESELTGPWFSEDGKTLFLSVQHPGEESESLTDLTSHWPRGGKEMPRPSVVAIRGF